MDYFKDSTDLLKESKDNEEHEYKIRKSLTALERQEGIFRCMFCEHEVPTRDGLPVCPFCGAPNTYLASPAEFFKYKAEQLKDLTEKEEADIRHTVELEIANWDYYKRAEELTDSLEWETYFRYMRRQEEYHAEEMGEILDIDAPDLELLDEIEPFNLPDNELDIFKKSIQIERDAIEFYKLAKENTSKELLISSYKALIEAEKHHIDNLSYMINLKLYRDN